MAPKVNDVLCGKCNKKVDNNVNKKLLCDGSCKKTFHNNCVGISDSFCADINSAEDNFWFCVNCKRDRNRRRSGAVTTPNNNTNQRQATASATIATTTPVSNEDIFTKLNSMQNQIINMQGSLNEYIELAKTISEENINLRNEVEILKEKMITLEHKQQMLKQNHLDHDIEICGVTVTNDEQLDDVVTRIAKFINIEIKQGDLKEVYRRKSVNERSGLPPAIIVRFHNKSKRDRILDEKRKYQISKKKLLNCKDCLGLSDGRNIYINERLTKLNGYLLKCARDLRKKKLLTYVWFQNGRVLIKKTSDDSCPVVHVTNKSQLDEFNI